jgi:hypothetical protein
MNKSPEVGAKTGQAGNQTSDGVSDPHSMIGIGATCYSAHSAPAPGSKTQDGSGRPNKGQARSHDQGRKKPVAERLLVTGL